MVWQRTDPEKLTLISDGLNYAAHERAARDIERELGHARVEGPHTGKAARYRGHDRAEAMQGERAGMEAGARKDLVTALYRESDSGRAFRAALAEQGLTLARGQRRGLVLVDAAGEVHSLTRQIRDARAKEIKDRLSDIDAARLPDAEQARERQQRARAGRDAEERHAAAGQGADGPDRQADRVSADQERPGSAERAADREDEIDRVAAGQARDWRALRGAQRAERHDLGLRQRDEAAEAAQAARDWLARERAADPPARGAHALWLRVTFRYGQHERMRQERDRARNQAIAEERVDRAARQREARFTLLRDQAMAREELRGRQERTLAGYEPETAEAIRERRTEYELGERRLPDEREQAGGGRPDDRAGQDGQAGAGGTARRDEPQHEREDAPAPGANPAEEIRTRAEPGRAPRDADQAVRGRQEPREGGPEAGPGRRPPDGENASAGRTGRQGPGDEDRRPDERKGFDIEAAERRARAERDTAEQERRRERDEKARDAGKQTGDEREKGRGFDPDAAERRAREQRQQERGRDRGGRERE
jgi:hypothetical protein